MKRSRGGAHGGGAADRDVDAARRAAAGGVEWLDAVSREGRPPSPHRVPSDACGDGAVWVPKDQGGLPLRRRARHTPENDARRGRGPVVK